MKLGIAVTLALAAPAVVSAATINLSTKPGNPDVQWQVSDESGANVVTAPPIYVGTTYYGGVLGLTFPFTDNDGFGIASTSFTLPANAQNVVLHINSLGVNDRTVAELNGHLVSDGITNGPGSGFMTCNDGGLNEPSMFRFGAGAQHIAIKRGFVSGASMFELIVNSTGSGIDGAPEGIDSGGPTNVASSPSWRTIRQCADLDDD